jgi:hypothetical protein
MRVTGSEANWAASELRTADLGSSRRVRRVELMLTRAAQQPGGKLSHVMRNPAELEGAYDLLEGGRVSAKALCASFADATFARSGDDEWMYAILDGTSVKVTDLTGDKGLGSIGNLAHGARGMKVITALGVDARGVTAGLLSQVWWARTSARKDGPDKRSKNAQRPLSEKETRHWVTAIEETSDRAKACGKRVWFQLDREGDNQDILLKLNESGQDFTVRAAWDRVTEATGEDAQRIRQRMADVASNGGYEVEVRGGASGRTPRTARMLIRAARVTLAMRPRGKGRAELGHMPVNVVWAREEGTTPAGEKPVDWLLLTTRDVDTFKQAKEVVDGYAQRWRIEDFHRVWKSSACRVEETQLRSAEAIEVWATMLASVAGRIERLRLLGRKAPDQPAAIDLSDHEIRALILLKRQHRRRNEVIPNEAPSIGVATLWIAELGGFTGKSSGGPPGAINIRRGLEVLGPAALMLQAIEAEA